MTEYPHMLYWKGGRTQGRVVLSKEEEEAANAEGWLRALPLDEKGDPIAPTAAPTEAPTEAPTAAPTEVPAEPKKRKAGK